MAKRAGGQAREEEQNKRGEKLNYMDGFRTFDPSIHLVFGTAMHETLQEWLDVLYNKSPKKATELDLGKMLFEGMITQYKKMREEGLIEEFEEWAAEPFEGEDPTDPDSPNFGNV